MDKWNQTRGPLQRAALRVKREGWAVLFGSQWRNHRQDVNEITQVTPIMLETLMVPGLARQHELALGAKWYEDPSMRVSFDFVAPYIRPASRKFNKYQKFCIMSCACEEYGLGPRHD
eukprot:9319513-Pyramimonas_sp.AAC.1